jgi:hypothetical protein
MRLQQLVRIALLLEIALALALLHPKKSLAQETQGLTLNAGEHWVPLKRVSVYRMDGITDTQVVYMGGTITTDKDGWTSGSRGGLVDTFLPPQHASFTEELTTFFFTKRKKTITIPVLTKAIRRFNQMGVMEPVEGRYQFTGEFKRQVTLGNGMTLDIVYQDTRMLIKETRKGKEPRSWNAMFYGLNVGANDFRSVVDYLKDFREELEPGSSEIITLGYKPEKGIIPVRIQMGGGDYFIPVLDYTVDEKATPATH